MESRLPAGVGTDVDADRVSAWFDAHARDLLRFCARRVGPELAEDVVATTFLVAVERRDQFDRGRSGGVLPWLYGIATNVLRRHRRDEVRAYRALARAGVDPMFRERASRPRSRVGGVVVEGPEQRAVERVDASRRARAVAGVLAGLPARQRDVLLLVAVAGLEYEEVATALGIPIGTVRSALHRARQKLRTALVTGGHNDE